MMSTKQTQSEKQKADSRFTAKWKLVYLMLIVLIISMGIGIYTYLVFCEKEGELPIKTEEQLAPIETPIENREQLTPIENGEELTAIENVRKKYEDQLMRLPNVNGVGIGKREGRAVIVVLVTQKTAEVEEVIPKTLEGFEVVVEEVGVIMPLIP